MPVQNPSTYRKALMSEGSYSVNKTAWREHEEQDGDDLASLLSKYLDDADEPISTGLSIDSDVYEINAAVSRVRGGNHRNSRGNNTPREQRRDLVAKEAWTTLGDKDKMA